MQADSALATQIGIEQQGASTRIAVGSREGPPPMCPKRPQSAAGAMRLGAALLLAGAAGLAPAQPAPPPASPPPPAPRSQWATAQRQSLLELEAADGRTMADREAVINVLGRSPTTVVEVARADQWLAPVLDAMAARTPASSAFHDDLVALAHRLREDARGPAVMAFDNRVANWTVALGSPRPHTLALGVLSKASSDAAYLKWTSTRQSAVTMPVRQVVSSGAFPAAQVPPAGQTARQPGAGVATTMARVPCTTDCNS